MPTNTDRAGEIVRALRDMLPEKVDYAKLVCAEGWAHGSHYVWTEPEPYVIDAAADLIENLQAQVAEWKKRHSQAAQNWQQENEECRKLQAKLAASQRRAQDARNELCLKCGRYREAHNGACDGCRWKEA